MKLRSIVSLFVILAVTLACQFVTPKAEESGDSGAQPAEEASVPMPEEDVAESDEAPEPTPEEAQLPQDVAQAEPEEEAQAAVQEPSVNLVATQRAEEDGQLKAKEYQDRGDTYLNDQAYLEAIDDYDLAIALDDKLIQAYWNRAIARYALGEYDRALEDIDATIKLWPGQPNPHYWRGLILYAQGEYEEALKAYDAAIEKTKAARWMNSNWDFIYAARKEAEDALNQ